ncbi:MAG: hypothetical protein J6V06_08845 [Clostridia bacterium]|nr:hypothetical protein [Clostridia bacterium]
MKERLSKLLTVKSLVTLSLTAVVVALALKGQFDIKDIYLLIIGFYFGTQHEKTAKEG